MLFRKLTLLLLAGSVLAACNAAVNEAELNDDNRFDLLPVVMKPILASDAKKCANFFSAVRNVEPEGSEDIKASYKMVVDFWAQVNAKLLNPGPVSKDLVKSVIIKADQPESPASIFPEGVIDRNNPATVSRTCGEYAGVNFVGAGLISFRKSVSMAESLQPGFYEARGMNLSEIMDGLDVIEARSDNLSALPDADIVTCTAAYSALKNSDTKYQQYANVWLTTLTDRVNSGRMPADSFADGNAVWGALTTRGFDAVTSLEKFDAVSEQCTTWMDEAVSKQQAKL